MRYILVVLALFISGCALFQPRDENKTNEQEVNDRVNAFKSGVTELCKQPEEIRELVVDRLTYELLEPNMIVVKCNCSNYKCDDK